MLATRVWASTPGLRAPSLLSAQTAVFFVGSLAIGAGSGFRAARRAPSALIALAAITSPHEVVIV
jgi:hypothetical protein